jgi:hypothetical protein
MYYNNMETFKLLHCIGAYGFGCWMVWCIYFSTHIS